MDLFIDLIERFRQNILFYNKKLKIVTKINSMKPT